MTFPRQDTSLGLEPSLLTVLPEGDNVIYSMENKDFNDEEVENYACSVYITGMNEFKEWAKKHDREKIIVQRLIQKNLYICKKSDGRSL